MTKQNFLLGKGERLTQDVIVPSGGGKKEDPYTFFEARDRLAPMIQSAVRSVEDLPPDACPHDEAIVSITLNPEYIAKSYYPLDLLRQLGAEVVGSKPKKIIPEKRSRGRVPSEMITTELFAKGSRQTFREWGANISNWAGGSKAEDDLVKIEEIEAPQPLEKMKGTIRETGNFPLEIVLHSDEMEAQTYLLRAFSEFLINRGYEADFGRRFYAKGLCFLEMDVDGSWVNEIATFSMVRALREMPTLRILRPTIRAADIPSAAPQIPELQALDPSIKVAIFDGGIPAGHAIENWVNPFEVSGMLPATEELTSHGTSVSSALLFGHIEPGKPLPQPYSNVDHYRVLDENPDQNPRELYEILERIDGVLSSTEYDFVNLSLGPRLAIEDDDIHAWTAVLDDRLSRSSILAAIAVGNDGEGDPELGFNRIQVPADCVNALAVGACNSPDLLWERAPYSSVGPGRSPGLIKPDLVEFGGSIERPFLTLSTNDESSLHPTAGTSFAAPSLLRLGTGVRAHFGKSINNLGIRTLLIHTAEESDHAFHEVGRGRVARNLEQVILCDDDTMRVIYQGEISPAKYIRAAVPFPLNGLTGMVSIKATICYKSITDPHHPGNYTRAGLDVIFRPHSEKFNKENQAHPNTRAFFGTAGLGGAESELRRDAMKWENCLHSEISMRGSGLHNPCFDIHYNARMEGRSFSPPEKLPYSMVITLKSNKVSDLYDQIVRDYATIIEPIRPILEVPIPTQ